MKNKCFSMQTRVVSKPNSDLRVSEFLKGTGLPGRRTLAGLDWDKHRSVNLKAFQCHSATAFDVPLKCRDNRTGTSLLR